MNSHLTLFVLFFLLLSCSIESAISAPQLLIQPAIQDLEEVNEGDAVKTMFLLRNTGDSTLSFTDVQAACGCTDVRLENWILAAGEMTRLFITVDTHLKTGAVKRAIEIYTANGLHETAWINLKIRPFDSIKLTGSNGSGLFTGKCATCHAEPVRNERNPARMFAVACAMCHGENGEGAYAPSLHHMRNVNFIADILHEGGDTRYMPAFANNKGGPLDNEQIDALASWLVSSEGLQANIDKSLQKRQK
ncbi:MAG: DUF1573 domain-containing protein [Mariprofundales bacterium]